MANPEAAKSCELCRSKGEKCWGEYREDPKCVNGIICCPGKCGLCLEIRDKCWSIPCSSTAVYANFNGNMTHCIECARGCEDDFILSPNAAEWAGESK
jgi:hypothetical protein